MQVSAVFSMGRSGEEQWAPQVLAELESPEPELRYEAALAAGELELLEALPMLSLLAEHEEDRAVREAAIEALGAIGGPEAERVLLRLLDQQDESIQEIVNMALQRIEFAEDVFPPLMDWTPGPDVFNFEEEETSDEADDENGWLFS